MAPPVAADEVFVAEVDVVLTDVADVADLEVTGVEVTPTELAGGLPVLPPQVKTAGPGIV